jgi:hypothetical protein
MMANRRYFGRNQVLRRNGAVAVDMGGPPQSSTAAIIYTGNKLPLDFH